MVIVHVFIVGWLLLTTMGKATGGHIESTGRSTSWGLQKEEQPFSFSKPLTQQVHDSPNPKRFNTEYCRSTHLFT